MFQQTSLSNPSYPNPLSEEEDSSSNVGGDVEPTDRPSAPSRDRTKVVGLGAMGALVAVGIGLMVASPRKPSLDTPPPLSLTSGELASADGGVAPAAVKEASLTVMDAGAVPTVRPPPVWRVANLKDDQNVELAEGTFGKNGFVGALSQAGLPRAEIRRVAHAFESVHRVERPSANDSFVFAKDKSKGTIVAFEYSTSPIDVWQARFEASANPAGVGVGVGVGVGSSSDQHDIRSTAKKLDLFVEHRKVASALVVSGDLAKAIAAAGMRPEIVEVIDDALEGHVDPGSIRAGVRMRVVATEDWVDGTFARVKVDAIEFVPKSGGAPLRVYFYERDASVEGSSRRAPLPGFYDAKGKQPYRGQFRSPLPLARVTSRFNPKRMHPVLKVVMPHQGVDYAGVTGTPVYASGTGTVITAGNGGPCGNMVEIDHGGGLATVYCHLKGFAQGLHSGQKVDARQLVGYVGQTGRVTGPHLHFGVKKNGVFIDPLGLKMDGVRVLPPADRDSFARKRADLDVIIDGVALPSAADVPEENEDKDLHTE